MVFRSPQTPLALYKARFGTTPGYFVDTAIGCWDFLLDMQRAMDVGGNVLEIGVYQGKSALLAACHMRAGETLILNDISPLDGVAGQVATLGGPATQNATSAKQVIHAGGYAGPPALSWDGPLAPYRR